MLDTLQIHLQLSGNTLILTAIVVLAAGVARGFAGFGLSALIMAALALNIKPLHLIPVCFLLEACASLVMFRGGMADGNKRLAFGLTLGYALGIPLGLMATHTLAPDASRLIALTLILTLALLQMFKVSPAFLRTRWGVYVTGFAAGTGTGLANIGGMVVALYVLALQAKTREIRGSIVLFLLLSMFVSAFWLITTGTLDQLALMRGATFAPFGIIGVLLGMWLFRPSLEPFYKRFCLALLITLALAGLGRLLLL